MNPIVYNEKGQFRTTDFVGYLPAFLQAEPDVVTLMQVMSDYINNAYRNIEVSEEFEFMVICTEARSYDTRKMMERLHDMFELASDRSDKVMYLSVPHNNVKSNAVLGNRGAEYASSIEVNDDKVLDQIPNATAKGVDSSLSDGSVVYVTYRKMNPVKTVSYYLDKESNILIKDPMGTSQDPFTDTDNAENRAIEFSVSDVGKVCKRYGRKVGNITYYEVFFTAKITDVASVPARAKANIDVDGTDGVDDAVVVDYYNMGSSGIDNYYTYIKFGGSDAFSWKSGYPTGIFYLRDTSSANLKSIRQENTEKGQTVELMPDMVTSPSVDRFRVNRIVDIGSGIYRIFLDSFPGIYSDALFYLSDSITGETLALMKMTSMSSNGWMDLGEYYVDLSLVTVGDSISNFTEVFSRIDRLLLLSLPLAYNKYMLDYSKAVPIIKWSSDSLVYAESANFGNNENVNLSSVTMVPNKDLGDGNCSGYNLRLLNTPETRPYIGMLLYSPDWVDLNTATPGTTNMPEYGKMRKVVQVLGSTLVLNEAGPLNDGICRVYSVTSGVILAKTDSDPEGAYAIMMNVGEATVGNFFIVTYADGSQDLCRINADGGVINGRHYYSILGLDEEKRTTSLPMTIVLPDGKCEVTGFEYIRYDGDELIAGVKKYSGELFSTKTMMAHDIDLSDPNVNVNLLTMNSDVEYVELDGKSWDEFEDKDQYIGKYVCFDSSPETVRFIASDGGPITDTLKHYAIKYKEVVNAFMPYYGSVATLGYEERPNYMEDMTVTKAPLYIKKMTDTRLKYGWKERQYLYYRDDLDVSNQDRSGFVEFYAGNEHSVVDVDLRCEADAYIDYPIMKYGYDPTYVIDIDDKVIALKNNNFTWTVTIKSSAHGIPDGSMVTINYVADEPSTDDPAYKEYAAKSYLFNQSYIEIDASNPDVLTYTVPDSTELSGAYYAGDIGTVYAYYDRSPNYAVSEVNNTTLVVSGFGGDSEPKISDYIKPGVTQVKLVGFDDGRNGSYDVVSASGGSIEVDASGWQEPYTMTGHEKIVVDLAEDDIVLVKDSSGEHIYRVTAGNWEELDNTSLVLPVTIYARQNLFDVSYTNPSLAVGKDRVIKRITDNGDGTADVLLRENVSTELSESNEGGRVLIRYVDPSVYNGWHTIVKYNGPSSFTIKILPKDDGVWDSGEPVLDHDMTANIGMWYKYTLSKYDWDKISNQSTFATTNRVSGIDTDETKKRIVTKYVHGFSVGDLVIFDYDGTTIYDIANGDLGNLKPNKVTRVIDEYTFTVENEVTDSDILYVYGGIITDDYVGNLRGVYSRSINVATNDGGTEKVFYTFKKGDIVVTTNQICVDEIRAWRVAENSVWLPLEKKRSLKIDQMGVDLMMNPLYDETDPLSSETEYKYIVYSDEVARQDAGDNRVFLVDAGNARNAHFEHQHLETLDTTQNVDLEYSSKYDYGTVAPRDGMASDFRGVPDMTYPLVEKIERLAYLKDVNVIDFELIGYLARYMGYDITSVSDDIDESNVYRNREEREKAIRETIEHLPQYYALGGTKPGLNMLMATFGLIGDLVTMWTNTANPYGELVRQDEVPDRIKNDHAAGSSGSGTWVPTPHVSLDIPLNQNMPNVTIGADDIARMREQIRVFKPINVVFDQINIVYETVFNLGVSMVPVDASAESGNTIVLSMETKEIDDVTTEDCYDDGDCAF